MCRYDPDDYKETGDNEYQHFNPYFNRIIWKCSRNPKVTKSNAKNAIKKWWKAGCGVRVFDIDTRTWCEGHVIGVIGSKLDVSYIVYVNDSEILKRTLVRRFDTSAIQPELSLVWYVMEFGVESLHKLEVFEEKQNQ